MTYDIVPEKKVMGVCSWMAYKFDVDVTLIRLAFVLATVFGIGSPILIYFIIGLVKPSTY